MPDLQTMRDELHHYVDVLTGREQYPLDRGTGTHMEVATVYYARALELESLLHQLENDGAILHKGKHYKFRTGELRSLLTLFKTHVELGSRRITMAQIELEGLRQGVDV